MIHREQDIINWGIARNIIGPTGEATKFGQWRKTDEESTELLEAINKGSIIEARDAIGDIIVTLILQAQLWGFSIEECLDAAWDEIKNRKGRMFNGVFVKEAQ
jgi:uncharacterized protein YabN with tetrapyrrole methylase and pyrophosphatase domain